MIAREFVLRAQRTLELTDGYGDGYPGQTS